MNILDELAFVLSNEEVLISTSVSDLENFNIKSIIHIIDTRDQYNPDFFLAQLESHMIDFFYIIINNSRYDYHKEKIEQLLQDQIDEEKIMKFKEVLVRMQHTFFLKKRIENIVVKNLG